MARKASQAKPPSWPAPPPTAPRQTSSGGIRESPRSVSTPVIPSGPQIAASSPMRERTRSSSVNAKGGDTAVLIPVKASPSTTGMAAPHVAFAREPTSISQDTRNPVLPITPKSPDARSPATGAVNLANEVSRPARSKVANQDTEVVDELLATMKQLLGTLGSTFDTLGDQTIKIATLPAAMDAVHQVCPCILLELVCAIDHIYRLDISGKASARRST